MSDDPIKPIDELELQHFEMELRTMERANNRIMAALTVLDGCIIRAARLAGADKEKVLFSSEVADLLLTAVEHSQEPDGRTNALKATRILLAAAMRVSKGAVAGMRKVIDPNEDPDAKVVI